MRSKTTCHEGPGSAGLFAISARHSECRTITGATDLHAGDPVPYHACTSRGAHDTCSFIVPPTTTRPVKRAALPEISRFLGITIYMLFNEHDPPHFHAVYGKHRIAVQIKTGRVTGTFPKRALRLVLEWRRLRASELLDDWDLARQQRPLRQIAPLE